MTTKSDYDHAMECAEDLDRRLRRSRTVHAIAREIIKAAEVAAAYDDLEFLRRALVLIFEKPEFWIDLPARNTARSASRPASESCGLVTP